MNSDRVCIGFLAAMHAKVYAADEAHGIKWKADPPVPAQSRSPRKEDGRSVGAARESTSQG